MPAMNDPQRILIVLPTWVGDAVMATPALRAIRQRYRSAEITWLGPSTPRAVLGGLRWADAEVDDVSKEGGWRALRRMGKLLRAGRFDLAVLLSNAFRTALLARLGRARRRVGYDRDSRGWLLTDRVQPIRLPEGPFKPEPMIDYYLRLAGLLGCDISDRRMQLAVSEPCRLLGEQLFHECGVSDDRPVVVLNPGASFGASKLWAPEKFAAVGDALRERCGAQIIVNAAPAERAIAEAVASAMREPPAIDFGRRENTIGLLKAVIARSDLVITGDTGPRHVAAALGASVVTLFGPTDPVWARIDYPGERIIRKELMCSPCQKKTCPLPAGREHHRCMKLIAVDEVVAAATALLQDTTTGARS
jgi:heptosyltransferase-2